MTSMRPSRTIPPPPDGDYLWDRRGTPDPLLLDLERTLGTLAFRAGPLPQQRPSVAWSWRTVRAVAAAVLFSTGVAWLAMRPERTTWEVTIVAGVDATDAPSRVIDRLRPGRWMQAESATPLRVTIANIGYVLVQPGSRLRMLTSRAGGVLTQPEHRLELDHGCIHAVISAPPRLFFVNTRAAVAIDYGCEYTLTVDEHGDGLLHVDQGLVMLDGHGRSVLVPMNASCPMRNDSGPGTPFGDHASPQLRQALADFDAGLGDETTLDAILAQCTNLDTVTLWHLLEQVAPDDRRLVMHRLENFVPLPPDISSAAILNLDLDQLNRWRIDVERYW